MEKTICFWANLKNFSDFRFNHNAINPSKRRWMPAFASKISRLEQSYLKGY